MKDTALLVSAIIFLLVSIMHLLRVALKVKIIVGNTVIPLWTSIFGFVIAFLMFVWVASLLKK